MVHYDCLKEKLQQSDENYPDSMPTTWLIILITVLGTLTISAWITSFLYCKYKYTLNHFRTSSIFWHKNISKEAEVMLSDSLQ